MPAARLANWVLLTTSLAAPLAAQTSKPADQPNAAASQPTSRPTGITTASLLYRLIDLDWLSTPPAGERTLMFTSADLASLTVSRGAVLKGSEDDAGHFLRGQISDDGWGTLAQVDGPGAITRLWVDKPVGSLRIVLDGQAVIAAEMNAFFAGEVAPFGKPLTSQLGDAGPALCELPMPFARSCKVETKGFAGRYEVMTTVFPPDTPVETFTPELDGAARDALGTVVGAIRNGLSRERRFGGKSPAIITAMEEIERGQTVTENIEGAGTVRTLYISLTDRIEPRTLYPLRYFVLRIFVDGQKTPVVEAPLVDFFGAGYRRTTFNSLPMGTNYYSDMPFRYENESWFLYCYFPMPFEKGLTFELENQNTDGKAVGLMYQLYVDREKPEEDRLRFHARFRRQAPSNAAEFELVEARGPGRLVGTLINVDSPTDEWWGAGDPVFWIDGNTPRDVRSGLVLWGTGLADYLGFRPPTGRATFAWHGITIAAPYGKNSGYRWHCVDPINFAKSLVYDLRIPAGSAATRCDFSGTAYWYGPAIEDPHYQPLSIEAVRPEGLRIPGSIEIEGNIVSDNWGTLQKQKYAGDIEYSGEQAALITQTTAPVLIHLPVRDGGRYDLGVRIPAGRSFTEVEFQTEDGTPIGTIHYEYGAENYLIGQVTLASGVNTLKVICDKPTLLDCWILRSAQEKPDGR